MTLSRSRLRIAAGRSALALAGLLAVLGVDFAVPPDADDPVHATRSQLPAADPYERAAEQHANEWAEALVPANLQPQPGWRTAVGSAGPRTAASSISQAPGSR